MSQTHHHRSRAWAPFSSRPSHVLTVDDHTHLHSTIDFSKEMAEQASELHQPVQQTYSAEQLLDFAQYAGVGQIIDVGCELPDWPIALDLARRFPDRVHAALAIHPVEAVRHGHRAVAGPDGLEVHYDPWHDVSYADAFAQLSQIAKQGKDEGLVVAIGETGLDFFRVGQSAHSLQISAFRDHIALAKELNLPMQIHDRDADQECMDTLLADGSPEVTIFHSFAGNGEMAKVARENGWYLSFSGTVTFRTNEAIRDGLREIDRSHILVETDAPYLTPMPWRGRTNASYLVPYTMAVMADVLDMSVDEVAQLTHDNACRAYGLPQ